jgi:hypothetical protein
MWPRNQIESMPFQKWYDLKGNPTTLYLNDTVSTDTEICSTCHSDIAPILVCKMCGARVCEACSVWKKVKSNITNTNEKKIKVKSPINIKKNTSSLKPKQSVEVIYTHVLCNKCDGLLTVLF